MAEEIREYDLAFAAHRAHDPATPSVPGDVSRYADLDDLVPNLAALRAIDVSTFLAGKMRLCKVNSNGHIYCYDASGNPLDDDGDANIAPNSGVGLWRVATPTFASVQRDWAQPRAGTSTHVPHADHQHSAFPQPGFFLVYAVDYDGLVVTGNDATAQPGYDADMATALAAAEATPYKTLDFVGQTLPRFGNGATLVVLVKGRTGGANYLNQSGGVQDMLWLEDLTGFDNIVVRGTSDFTNNANDKIVAGFAPVTGTNVGGYNAIGGSTANALTCQRAGGGAAALSVESGGFGQLSAIRVRFSATTTTVALRNVARMVYKNTTNVITLDRDLPAVPVASDVFFIESPNVGVGDMAFDLGENTAFNLVGFKGTNWSFSVTLLGNQQRLCGCTVAERVLISNFAQIAVVPSYQDETFSVVDVGMGLRSNGLTAQNGLSFEYRSSGSSDVFPLIVIGVVSRNIGAGCLIRAGIVDVGGGADTSGAAVSIGNAGVTTTRRLRISATPTGGGFTLAGLYLGSSSTHVQGVDVSGVVGVPLILVPLDGTTHSIQDVVSTDGGNSGAAVLQVSGRDNTVTVNGITATSAADIHLFNATVASFVGLSTTDYRDDGGNHVQGAANALVSDSVVRVSQSDGVDIPAFLVMRATSTSSVVTRALADTLAHATGIAGVTITPIANGQTGLMVASGYAWIRFDSAPTPGRTAYVSDVNPGQAVGTSVPTIPVALGTIIRASTTPAPENAPIGLVALTALTPVAPSGGVVVDITAGTGISVGGTAPHPTVANTGILAVSVTAPIHSTGGQSPTLSHDASGVAAGTYNSLTVDTKGHVTAASNVSVGTVSSIVGTAPIHVVGGTGPTATISHDASGVTAGLYNNVTVDAKGHVTDGVIVPDPYILMLSYGPLGDGRPNGNGSDGTLPALFGDSEVPIFWLKPSTDINNVSRTGTVSDQFIVEWPVDDTYGRAALSVYMRHLDLSATVGLVTMTMVVTKNGVATATGIAFPATETDTLHTSTQFVSFVPGDLVGVRVTFSSNYASGTMLCAVRVKLT